MHLVTIKDVQVDCCISSHDDESTGGATESGMATCAIRSECMMACISVITHFGAGLVNTIIYGIEAVSEARI